MATVTISGPSVRDGAARPDNRPWYAWAAEYQDGGDGGVITPKKSSALTPVAGVLEFQLEAGVTCYLQNPDGDTYLVTVPDSNTALWDLIAAAVLIPPGTPQELLNAALEAYFTGSATTIGSALMLAADQAAARAAIGATTASEVSELPLFVVSSHFGSFGAGDDTAAIQAALDAAADAGGSSGRGGRVVIPYLNGYIPKASQLKVPYGVTLSGGSWSSFGGKLKQLSGVNDDFIILADNGNTGSNPWGGPCVIEKLALIGAPGATAGHAISWRFPDGRKAKIQDLTTIEKLFIVGFAGSGFYAVGCGPLYIRDVNAIFNGGYGIELVDPQNFEAGALGHIALENISGDGNKGYLSDKGGATIYLEGIKSFYGCSLHGIKSEYRLGINGYGGNSTTMGNRNAVLIKNCAGAIDVSGLTHISSYGQTRKPDSAIRVIGTVTPNLTWRGASVRSTLTTQTVDWNGDAANTSDPVPVVRNDVDSFVSYFTSGKIGPESAAPVNPISSNLATDPDFENTLLWKQDLPTGWSLSTTQKASGSRSLKLVAPGSGLLSAYLFRDPVTGRGTNALGAKPVNPGESYRASVRVYRPSANTSTGTLAIYLEFTDSLGVNSADTTQAIGVAQSTWTADSWTANTLTVCGTVPAGYDRMQVRLSPSSGSPPTSGDIFYIDGVRIEPEILGSRTHAATAKTTPVDADEFLIADSVVTGSPAVSWIKKVTFGDLKTTLAAWLTTLTATWSNKTLTSPLIKDANGNTLIGFASVASAVNSILFSNNSTGNRAQIKSFSSVDTNVDIDIIPQGSGALRVNGSTVTINSAAQTISSKRITPRINTTTSSATPTINTDNCDQFNITALAAAITSMTTNLSGTPTDGDRLLVRFKDDGTGRAITWGSKFTGNLLATTVAGKTHVQQLVYDTTAAKWVGTYVDTSGY